MNSYAKSIVERLRERLEKEKKEEERKIVQAFISSDQNKFLEDLSRKPKTEQQRIWDLLKTNKFSKSYLNLYLKRHSLFPESTLIFDTTARILEKFNIKFSDQEKLLDEVERNGYAVVKLENEKKQAHPLLFIKKGSGIIEHFDSNGLTYADLIKPDNLYTKQFNFKTDKFPSLKTLEDLGKHMKSSNKAFQCETDSCFSHTFNRFLNRNKTNEEYEADTEGTTDAKVVETHISHLKKGGLINEKKGKPVPIIAHGGELVVPADIVPKVLKSNAWLDHVKNIQKERKISYKQAMQEAKGTYKK